LKDNLIGYRLLAGIFIVATVVAISACTKKIVHEQVLDNGLKVIVREDHRAPVVVSQIWYKVGAIDEPAGLTGISHVLEHVMFKGTKNHKMGEFSKIIAEQGGRENAFTGKDYTAYFQQLEKSRLEISFELEADRMHNLIINDEEAKKEIRVVMEERRLRTDDKPESLTYEKFMATAFQKHAYRNPVIGWMKDLESITTKDLEQWYKRWYAPNNATLVVVGDVDPDEVFRLAKKHYGKVPRGEVVKPRVIDEPEQKKMRSSQVSAPAKVPYIIFGYHAPVIDGSKNQWEPYALSVLAGVLDGGSSSRFTRELIRGSKVAASAGAGYSMYSRGPGMFLFDGNPASKHTIAELEQAIHKQIDLVKKEPVSDVELKRVKAQVLAGDIFSRDSVFYQAMRIGTLETIGLDHRLLDDYVKNIQAVTAEQVKQVANKYFVEKNLTRTELKPTKISSSQPGRPARAGGSNVRH
jgi:zinc protease